MAATPDIGIDLGKYKLGWSDEEDYVFKPKRGLSEDMIREMSWMKGEPDWMLDFRLKSLRHFERRPMPTWGGDMSGIDFDNIFYYIKPTDHQVDAWDELPDSVKNTYEKLGIPEAERKYLAGVTAQYESEVVYHRNREDLEKQGVLFTDMDTALREHPEIVKKWFGKIIPQNDNKFSALNSATWSGGCLTANARINVRGKGLVSIADVVEGDEVYGVDVGRNLERGKVLARIESGVKPAYKIRVAGRELEATGNHMFLVARQAKPGARWTAEWCALDEIEVGEPIAVSRELPDDGEPIELPGPIAYTRNKHRAHLRFPSDTSGDMMWLLGLWLGDGHTATPREHMRQISFSVPDTDPVYEPAIEAAWRIFGVDHVTPVKCGFVVNSKELGVWLEELGFFGHAKTKRLPAWVYSLPHYQQLALLGGIIDADGWTENDGATMSIELANRPLLEDLKQLAIGCGLFSDGQIVERTRTAVFGDGHEVTSTCWRLRVQGDLSRVWTRDPKKAGKPASKGRNSRYSAATGLNFGTLCTDTVGFAVLREKTPIGEQMTYDIQVVGLESFVANGIVAHNSFIYIPPNVNVEMPLQAYFRINAENMGQFERTLIIADEGSQVHYIEGCSAPVYTTDSLHSAVVEIQVGEGARVTYTTIQNWSNNVYNLVTKRARVEAEGHMEWIDGNIGCLAEGSTITTPSGVKPIELVTPGDQVLSFDEATGSLVFRTVTAKRMSGMQPVREVRVGERRLHVTDNHPFYAPTDAGPAYVRADRIDRVILPSTSALSGVSSGGSVGTLVRADVSVAPVQVGSPGPVVRTWDIEVEGTGNFVSEGFIVHNSRLTMKYPAVYMVGPKASGEVLSVAYAGPGQHQDAGAKMVHAAPETTSKIVSKSISKDGGRTSYRGLVHVDESAYGVKSHVQCDALILDDDSVSDTFPYMEVGARDAVIGHEATVSKVADEQLFYLMSRGLSQEQAMGMIVNGFIEPVTRTLPMEYAVEWSRLIELQMEGSVG